MLNKTNPNQESNLKKRSES